MTAICDRRNLAFVHIPSTSGINLCYHLMKDGFVQRNKIHERVSEVPDQYTKFSIIRDPWGREISMYNHMHNNYTKPEAAATILYEMVYNRPPDTTYGRDGLEADESYQVFLEYDMSTFEGYIKSKYVNFNTESRYMHSPYSTLSYFLDGDCRVLRYENLVEDYAKLAEEFNLPKNAIKTRLNKNDHNQEVYWTDELRDIVYPFYEECLERFKYE